MYKISKFHSTTTLRCYYDFGIFSVFLMKHPIIIVFLCSIPKAIFDYNSVFVSYSTVRYIFIRFVLIFCSELSYVFTLFMGRAAGTKRGYFSVLSVEAMTCSLHLHGDGVWHHDEHLHRVTSAVIVYSLVF